MGSRLQVQPDTKILGPHRVDEFDKTSLTLRNHGGSAVSVVGAIADCSCIANQGLPRRIPPGGSIELPVSIHFGKTVGTWKQSIRYLTDHPRHPQVKVVLQADIVPSTGENQLQSNEGKQQ